MFCLLATLILIDDRKLRVQIRGLMQTAFYLILFKTGLLKDFRIRQEIDLCSGLLFFRSPEAVRSQARAPALRAHNGHDEWHRPC